jgi:hypothetical protein
LTRGQKARAIGFFVVVGVSGLLWVESQRTPIPMGHENWEKARAFLKEQFPDREASPRDRVTAPVAVVYELIRSGEPEIARRAIGFAADQRFGHAAPYVIERLGSGDPELERAARDFLREIAGRDYGPDAESWRAWWRDPSRKHLGVVSVGQTTLAIGVLATLALAGVCLLAVGPRKEAGSGCWLVLLAWLMGCVWMAMPLFGNSDACTFGSSQITYHVAPTGEVGLEDAPVGGTGRSILLIAVGVFGGLALMVACAAIAVRRARAASVQTDRKTKGSGFDAG